MFSENAITAITDIPALVHAFGSTAGWTVTGTTSAPILTRAGGGLSFTLTAGIASYDHTLTWTNSNGAARIVSPKLNGTASVPVVSIPSKVYLFGDADFIAIVIEYGFNKYRHLYLGNTDTGHEVISGATPRSAKDSFLFPIDYRGDVAYLFGANHSVHSSGNCGGVYVNHADNPVKWRKFLGPTGFPLLTLFDNTVALGGFGDDVNDGYVARGRSSHAGAQILVPINLYVSMPITGDTLFVPVGTPAGVRMVNMADIDPAGTFTLGGDTWQCFPALAKSGSTSSAQNGTGWAANETSYMVGYAYPRS